MNRPIFLVIAYSVICVAPASSYAAMMVELGSAHVGLPDAGGGLSASFDIAFHNPDSTAALLAGYTLFLDIDPAGDGLPAGVSFASPAASYIAGQGTAPLPGAGPGSMNLDPAAGDLGLGQLQLSDGEIGPDERFTMLTINLSIDPNHVSPGAYDITLAADVQSTLDSLAGPLPFTVSEGVLKVTNTDFDNDGDTDGQDFLIWQRGVGSERIHDQGDADGNGVVDGVDLALWETGFGHTSTVPLTVNIPEPVSLLLLVQATASLSCRQRYFLSTVPGTTSKRRKRW